MRGVTLGIRLEAVAVSVERLVESHATLLVAAEQAVEHIEVHGTCLGPACVAENAEVRAAITQGRQL